MSRAPAATVVLAVVAAAVAVAFTWQPTLASLYDDSVSYLLMAQWYSPFHPATAAVAAAAPLEKYPPLFPLLLALTGGAFDWRLGHALVAVAFGASVALLAMHAGRLTGSAPAGFAAALAYSLMPGVWINLKGILSEFPYLALTLGAILAHGRVRSQPGSRSAALALGGLAAAALLTRTIGIALVAAIVVAALVDWHRAGDARRLRGLAWTAGLPLASAALWYLLRPAGGEDAYATYSGRVASDAAQQGLARLATAAATNASAVCDAWLWSFLVYWGEWWKPGVLLASGLGIVGAAATAWRALRGEMDAVYCVAFFAILLAWPFPGQIYRLALPAFPLVLANIFWVWRIAANRFSAANAEWRTAALAALPLVLCVPATVLYVGDRARAPVEPGASMAKSEITEFYRIPSGPRAAAAARAEIGVFDDMARIRAATPEGARILWYVPSYINLLAGRTGVQLEHPRDVAHLARQVATTRAEYLYAADVQPRDSAHREGDPLDAAKLALPFATIVLRRGAPNGATSSVLMAIDPARLPRPGKEGP